ncbi:MAG TPA: hypothetical protein VJ045_07085 [Hyphomicrobiaceae bacterium]|nr:hypothetical protein [Hyphomicrobiaceae bacterium]
MSKIFALLAIVLIVSGIILIAAPREEPGSARSLSVEPAPSLLVRVREIAERVNAPLSIFFGVLSLYYTRRTFHVARERAEAAKPGSST